MDLNAAKMLLEEELKTLDGEDTLGADDQKTVTLDQQSVGRLSRMDAMQRQAMAQATARRRAGRRVRIVAALKRLEDGEFGYCQECGEDIPAARITLDPTVMTCLPCAKG